MMHLRLSVCRSNMLRRKLRKFLKVTLGICVALFFLLLFLASTEQPCPPEGCGSSGEFIHRFPKREVRSSSEVKRILRWTGFFEDPSWEETDDSYFKSCKVNQCTMTNDKSLFDQSDAVLFHAGALWNFWKGVRLPSKRHAYQVWILHNVEPPPRVPLNLVPFAGVFNWTAWYRTDSDVPVGYGGYTNMPMPPSLRFNQSMKPNWSRENNRFSAWMSSNCYDYNRRQLVINELKAQLGHDMDLYGKCGGKRCPETVCYDTISNYKFFFTFENCNCRDYISEKFWAALLRRQVPVVLGGSSPRDYAKIAPPHSFIHVKDFKDTAALVEYLYYLDKNETAYNEYLDWTTQNDVYSELPARRKWWCKLCEALHNTSRPAQVYTDIAGWMQEDSCPQWSIANQLGRLFDGFRIKIGLL
ncbi:glycoprotein 3-alpha-L-fucosyltransferase A-like [Physella acuta]|uniref:glycoprotein 3-alpha-L-fucosyltransferase A-like n=1 Tax=Physella acuta TaxID=109671 RepID=UPI0027DE1EF6|nr:glycoprotein 3-alpha-L-fucosyltransferase A-like [Physella acuta]XP_059146706.1 glycoprotein 3-alpha-L-fucosyltransferase A-like [Physella acuta]